MRFRTRAFLVYFVPFALLLGASFWMIQRSVQSTVREEVRASLRENQLAIAHLHAKSDLQNSRFLKIAGENPALKAGIQLLLSEGGSEAARRTVEDQLRELGEHMGFDFLLVSAHGQPLAGAIREKGQLVPLDTRSLPARATGLLLLGGRPVQVGSVPLDEDVENIGFLSVGQYFDISQYANATSLMHEGQVIESSIPGVTLEELTAALSHCPSRAECDVKLHDTNWITLPIQGSSEGGEYVLRSWQNVDEATGPLLVTLRHLFLTVAFGSVLVALLCGMISSHSIVKPIAAIVSHLRKAGRTGTLPEFQSDLSPIVEIRELTESYNRAAASVRLAQEGLQGAYVEFIGTLANALDARDNYTAGHSWRVSQLSCALAAAMNLSDQDIEKIRTGALLHDIGKIGVGDAILQKPGKLTHEEFAAVKEHPVIGRRILEGVQGFAPFLPAVELHHENWDGSGYPKGLVACEAPLEARIIHVADAYDAMTTNRSYRQGMTHEKAMSILREFAGIQFDPRIVELFEALPLEIVGTKMQPSGSREDSRQMQAVETV